MINKLVIDTLTFYKNKFTIYNFSYLPCDIRGVVNLTDNINDWDCVCVIDSSECKTFVSQFAVQREFDNAFDNEVHNVC